MNSIEERRESAWVSAEKAIPQIALAFGGDLNKAAAAVLDLAARQLLRARAVHRSEMRVNGDGDQHWEKFKNSEVPVQIWPIALSQANFFDWQINSFRGLGPIGADSDPNMQLWVVLTGLKFSHSDLKSLRSEVTADRGKTLDLRKAIPRGTLKKWLIEVPNRQEMTVLKLIAMAEQHFLGMSARRDPFRALLRELDGPRKRGAKPKSEFGG